VKYAMGMQRVYGNQRDTLKKYGRDVVELYSSFIAELPLMNSTG